MPFLCSCSVVLRYSSSKNVLLLLDAFLVSDRPKFLEQGDVKHVIYDDFCSESLLNNMRQWCRPEWVDCEASELNLDVGPLVQDVSCTQIQLDQTGCETEEEYKVGYCLLIWSFCVFSRRWNQRWRAVGFGKLSEVDL